jgi:predicted transcriptional regulator
VSRDPSDSLFPIPIDTTKPIKIINTDNASPYKQPFSIASIKKRSDLETPSYTDGATTLAAGSLLDCRRQSVVYQYRNIPISTKKEVNFRRTGTGTPVKSSCIVTYKSSGVQIISTYVIFVLVLASLNILSLWGTLRQDVKIHLGHVYSAGWL